MVQNSPSQRVPSHAKRVRRSPVGRCCGAKLNWKNIGIAIPMQKYKYFKRSKVEPKDDYGTNNIVILF